MLLRENERDLYLHHGPSAKHRTVLLVEDEPGWQMIIGKILKTIDTGIHMRCVRSMKHAEQALYQNHKVEMIISDLMLEGDGSGLDFYRTCQKTYPAIPFLMISGMKEGEAQKQISDLKDPPAFYPKPMNYHRLRSLLQSTMQAELKKKELDSSPKWESVPGWARRLTMIGAISSSVMAPNDTERDGAKYARTLDRISPGLRVVPEATKKQEKLLDSVQPRSGERMKKAAGI